MKRTYLFLSLIAVASVYLFLNNGCKKANDTTPPIILLKGLNPYYLNLNSAYIEYGAIANDNVDGDISNQIVITGVSSINSDLKGTYSVNYSIKDAAGNSYNTIRKVIVMNSADSLAGNYNVNDSCWNTGLGSFTSKITVSNTINGLMKIYDFMFVGDSITGSLNSIDSSISFTPNQYLGNGDTLINAFGKMSIVDTSFNGSGPVRNLTINYKWYNGSGTDTCRAYYIHQ